VNFGEAAAIHDQLAWRREWFNRWLKGVENSVGRAAPFASPVRIFVMGTGDGTKAPDGRLNHGGYWRDEQEWPLARTRYTRYYLHSRGAANTRHGDGTLSTDPPAGEPADGYVYDPGDPAPTRGGNTLIIPYGVADQTPVEERPDVLVYTGDLLEQDLEITGPIRVHLFAASSARDTDFTAKLVDVRPDGYAQNLQDGIVRARYRRSAVQPSLITPGQVYEYTIDLWATSQVLKAGHRLRLDISSSNFPRFDRNPNTGTPIGVDDRLEAAQQAVHHSAAYPSHVVLPVIPR
jgi:putative CocE/NonD family hydrolase